MLVATMVFSQRTQQTQFIFGFIKNKQKCDYKVDVTDNNNKKIYSFLLSKGGIEVIEGDFIPPLKMQFTRTNENCDCIDEDDCPECIIADKVIIDRFTFVVSIDDDIFIYIITRDICIYP